ncbi:alpha/beta hydrolase-fold protein [Pedobacter sp. CG_S7]|uniref:alpha/beta hydrolase n=1 Tax=Pedobacter sp. CG_S7 TaxID=3143930 RepID=UPI003395BF0A
MLTTEIKNSTHELVSVYLKRTVKLDIFVPEMLSADQKLNLLLLNDGQAAGAMELQSLLNNLYATQKMEAVVVIAIHACADRLQEYGVAGVPDFQQRGAKAGEYAQFIKEELFPFLLQQLALPINGITAFAGFSLGGLSAFDIVYNYPEVFDLAGVFSGAFWWRKKDLKDGYNDDQDRIVHQMIRNSKGKSELRFWLMTGTADELTDRNNNYIIDSVDDTIDVIKELLNKGFQRHTDLYYYEMVGGKHNINSWSQAFPAFLIWAFSGIKH